MMIDELLELGRCWLWSGLGTKERQNRDYHDRLVDRRAPRDCAVLNMHANGSNSCHRYRGAGPRKSRKK
ncbi:hypothetical protein BDN71DRAFT_1440913 [Pleurotus eryngii]|uniref:Uncharacterized protein n=1 Tax=Pleurotus eryngii TaxID=5323 RepID=A0A9P6A558_PLEER|nr:hypothetical protein BDN71DRAFT_1440913 [Pleurotus eryngii]